MKQIDHVTLQSPLLGQISFKPFLPDHDSGLLHSWLTQPYAKFWGMENASIDEVKAFYSTLINSGHETAYLGYINDTAQFLIEIYDVSQHEIASHIDVTAGDIGFHILLAPNRHPIRGFSHAVMQHCMQFIFDEYHATRILVEPDCHNHKVHALNLSVGFRHLKTVRLKQKQALLGELTKTAFNHSKQYAEHLNSSIQLNDRSPDATQFASHIKTTHWQKANQQLIVKMITEFSHERLITPFELSTGSYLLTNSNEQMTYHFSAKQLPLDHLMIDASSLVKTNNQGEQQALDALAFLLEFASKLGLADQQLATYLEEVSSTLSSACYKYAKRSFTASELVHQSFQTVESEMTHGHPSFIANNGRIGFDATDFHQYAPEAATPIQIVWLAGAKTHTAYNAINDINYQSLIDSQLDLSEQLFFEKRLAEKGLLLDDYYLIPVHPWQWENKLVHLYTRELANNTLVCLGAGFDKYLPQQSIRTLFNLSKPNNHYVKVALSILNMGFMRGLSAKYMAVTPAINQWVYDLVLNDTTLSSLNFVPLRELATLGFSGSHYEDSQLGDTPYKKMIAALWRDNPTNLIDNSEQLATMASLLHQDNNGNAYIVAKINASKRSPEAWLKAYLKAYLIPLLHCFYKYKLVFMPHGENLILRFKDHVPVGVFMKDIGEEVCVLNSQDELPEEIARIAITMPKELELLSIFTDVFDCIFRYMVPLLAQENCLTPKQFWQLVATEIKQYQAAHPELSERFAQYDIFCDEFELSCLNRLQLKNNKQMVDLTDPANSLQFAGKLANPIALFKD